MADETAESTPSRKISAKTVWGKIRKGDIPEKGVKQLFRVIGSAMGTRKGSSEYGEWTALVGNFEAVNLATGEVFAGPECFLPEPFNGMVAGKFDTENPPNSIEFAFEVGIKAAAEDAQVPYEYTCKPLRDPTAADPLAALRARLPALALPKPPKDEGDAKGKGK